MIVSTRKKRLGREELQRIVELCKSIEEKGLNPFLIEVEDLVEIIREYFPKWEKPEELCLDAEALNKIASVIKLQSEWLKRRTTSLYTDPFLIEDKLRTLTSDEIVEVFLESWRPIVELEQISIHSLGESLMYWESLLPLDERWRNIGFQERESGRATLDEMVKQGLLADKAFSEMLESFWEELKMSVGEDGKIRYWDFIGAETYEETFNKAYLTSFLVTYGYATLEIHPLEEDIFVKPYEKPTSTLGKEQLISIPIPVSYEEWLRWREGREA
ncbi:MAG: hypothetical protein ACE5NN_04240 [Candidatus Bathyarchaeia archaeon]